MPAAAEAGWVAGVARMAAQRFVAGMIPRRFVEVDAARLLLTLARFAAPIGEPTELYSGPTPTDGSDR